MVDWHRREERVAYGEYHRLRIKPDEELRDEPRALVDLRFVGRVLTPAGKSKAAVDRYRYPAQENDVRPRDDAKFRRMQTLGRVEAVDKQAGTIDIKKRVDQNEASVDDHRARPLQCRDARGGAVRIAERVLEHGLDAETVVRDLLLGRPSRGDGRFRDRPAGESAADFAVRIAGELGGSQLAIQGPPGAGKTYTGARMIRALLAQGRKVGVVATSHKVIQQAAGRRGSRRRPRRRDDSAAHRCEEGAPIPVDGSPIVGCARMRMPSRSCGQRAAACSAAPRGCGRARS